MLCPSIFLMHVKRTPRHLRFGDCFLLLARSHLWWCLFRLIRHRHTIKRTHTQQKHKQSSCCLRNVLGSRAAILFSSTSRAHNPKKKLAFSCGVRMWLTWGYDSVKIDKPILAFEQNFGRGTKGGKELIGHVTKQRNNPKETNTKLERRA